MLRELNNENIKNDWEGDRSVAEIYCRESAPAGFPDNHDGNHKSRRLPSTKNIWNLHEKGLLAGRSYLNLAWTFYFDCWTILWQASYILFLSLPFLQRTILVCPVNDLMTYRTLASWVNPQSVPPFHLIVGGSHLPSDRILPLSGGAAVLTETFGKLGPASDHKPYMEWSDFGHQRVDMLWKRIQ